MDDKVIAFYGKDSASRIVNEKEALTAIERLEKAMATSNESLGDKMMKLAQMSEYRAYGMEPPKTL